MPSPPAFDALALSADNEGMESDTSQPGFHRPWYRLHLLTWLLLFCVGASLVVENVVGQGKVVPYFGQLGYRHGFPKSFLFRSAWIVVGHFQSEKTSNTFTFYLDGKHYPDDGWYDLIDSAGRLPFDGAEVKQFDPLALAFNIITLLLLLAATTKATESYLRRQAKWHQFSIQFILAFTAFVALILANAKSQTTPIFLWTGDVLSTNLVRWHGNETWEYIPFFFSAVGLWCVFWTGWEMIVMGVGRVFKGRTDR